MKNITRFNRFPALSACLALLCSPALLAADDNPPKPDKIFTGDRVLAVRLDAPWREIMRHKERDQSWTGTFEYTDENGQTVSIPVGITTRGLTRLRVCDFPPLRLDFDKEASKGTAFRGAGNLKLVTHCFANSRFEQYYIKEYLSYRIYNLVTDKSYRVQGLDMSYESGGGKPINRFAFLIEDPDDVAKRNGLEKLNLDATTTGNLDSLETSRFMLFQYLISNLDWSVLSGPKEHCCHNARLIGESLTAATVFAIPYDLDSSGLVDTHYAAPPANLRVRSIRQRLFRGFCEHNVSVPVVLDQFRELREPILALFENEARLDNRNRSGATKFIEQFYRMLESPKDVEKQLIGNCRG